MKTKCIAGLFLFLFAAALPAQLATAVERHGIRWTFQTPVEVGTFANGDWFVVGPVTIAFVTPGPQTVNGRAMNGSMVNPSFLHAQAYDSGGQWMSYDGSRAVTFPRPLQPGDSLVSTVSNEGTSGSLIKTAAVLTVLPERPAMRCFRPPYAGTQKPLYPTSLMRPENLVRLTAPAFAARLAELQSQFERLWLEGASGWAGEYAHPSDAQPMYYRDFSTVSTAMFMALAADVDVGQKIGAAVAFMQWGIDARWNVTAGWFGDGGGHGTGRKAPIVFAGVMGIDDCLRVNEACKPPHPMGDHRAVFTDDGQTWFVMQSDVGRNGYTQAMVGLPEWCNYHYTYPAQDDPSWETNPYRRCCHNNAWHGQFLVLRAMGGLQAWNWPAAFSYHDRYVQECFARGEADFIKAWGDIAYFNEYRRLRQADLRGTVTIGVPAAGAPKLLAATPPHQGQSWLVHVDAGAPGVVAGLLTRSRKTVLRPSRTWGPFTTQGLVFVAAEDFQASVAFLTGADGKAAVSIPPSTDVAGNTFTLQAVVLTDDGLVPTNAAEVNILPPLN